MLVNSFSKLLTITQNNETFKASLYHQLVFKEQEVRKNQGNLKIRKWIITELPEQFHTGMF